MVFVCLTVKLNLLIRRPTTRFVAPHGIYQRIDLPIKIRKRLATESFLDRFNTWFSDKFKENERRLVAMIEVTRIFGAQQLVSGVSFVGTETFSEICITL